MNGERPSSNRKKGACRFGRSILTYGLVAIVLLGLFQPVSEGGCTRRACSTVDWTPEATGWLSTLGWYDDLDTQPITAQSDDLDTQPEDTDAQSNDAEGGEVTLDSQDPSYPAAVLLATSNEDLLGWVILDARSPEEYSREHLQGARNLYWQSIQSDGVLDATLAEQALRKLGVNNTDNILVYGNPDGASYLFWALDFLGHDNLRRLDGSLSAFGDLEEGESTLQVSESSYTANIRPDLRINEDFLDTAMKNARYQLLDGRTSLYDRGTSHLKWNIVIPVDELYQDEDSRKLKSASDLEALFARLDSNKVQIVYGTPEACSLYFSLKLMGYDAAVLDGDWWKNTEYAASSIS
jgi:thiosulfate/3-mercaptopyruvate sulfurtransferase